MIGSIIIWTALFTALAAACLYFISVNKQKYLHNARTSFYISVFGVAASSALLMLYILQHRFEYSYIANYSSRDLPLHLLITTFWAGQEGSFLLWAFFAAVIGLVLRRTALREHMEGEVMTVYSLIISLLLLLIAIKSPFQLIWDVAANNVPNRFIPQDGMGLNPLLQNFWMIIHPPVLFLGFASLAVPFVFAVSALWQKKYESWIHNALPWVLFGALSLGAGLILGGYWAYGVLGWGGWWGWDPVENSSLIPWIVIVMLIHTMIIQILTGKLVRTNFVLAVIAYILVVYSTFLTRSGALADASVHSFVDPGAIAYTFLIVWIAAIAISGFGMIALRYRALNIRTASSAWLTRDSLLSIAIVVMGVCAAVILFGTSRPLFSYSSVEPSFYERTTLPLAVLLTVLLGFSLHTKWKLEDTPLFLKRIIVPGILSSAVFVLLVLMGLRNLPIAILALTSIFALFASIHYGYLVAKENPRFAGGALAHAGLAILFLGIIGSGSYSEKQIVSLPLNQEKSIFDCKIKYIGTLLIQDGKSKIVVYIENNGKQTLLEPEIIQSGTSNTMRTPDYVSYWTRDIYIEPLSIEQNNTAEGQPIVDLVNGVPVSFDSLIITFIKFDLASQDKADMIHDNGAMTVGAVLRVKTARRIETVIPTTTYSTQGDPDIKTAYLKNGQIGFQLIAIDAASDKTGKSRVGINVVHTGKNEHSVKNQSNVLIAEVSVKPFMNLIWIAALLIVSGLAIAIERRIMQSKK